MILVTLLHHVIVPVVAKPGKRLLFMLRSCKSLEATSCDLQRVHQVSVKLAVKTSTDQKMLLEISGFTKNA